MTTENPAEQLAQTITSLRNDVNSLQSKDGWPIHATPLRISIRS